MRTNSGALVEYVPPSNSITQRFVPGEKKSDETAHVLWSKSVRDGIIVSTLNPLPIENFKLLSKYLPAGSAEEAPPVQVEDIGGEVQVCWS